MKLGQWYKADRVRVVKKNGKRVVERQIAKKKRKPAKRRKAKATKRKR